MNWVTDGFCFVVLVWLGDVLCGSKRIIDKLRDLG